MDDETEIILSTQRYFGVELSAARLSEVRSLRDMCNLVVDTMNARQPTVSFSFEQIWPGIQEITANVLGCFEGDLSPDMEYGRDLNV